MAQLSTRDHALVAALLYQRIKPLKPLDNPDDVQPFNEYRALSARLAGLFEDDAYSHVGPPTTFDPIRFISYVMTGAPE